MLNTMKDAFADRFGRGHSRDVRSHFERDSRRFGADRAETLTRRALADATFNRGPLAGRTGDPFKDKPFFNPWAKGGTFNP